MAEAESLLPGTWYSERVTLQFMCVNSLPSKQRSLLGWNYITCHISWLYTASADESQQGRNSSPLLPSCLSVLDIFYSQTAFHVHVVSASQFIVSLSWPDLFWKCLKYRSTFLGYSQWSPNPRSPAVLNHDWGETEWNLVVVVHNQLVIQVLFEKKSVSVARECTFENLSVENFTTRFLRFAQLLTSWKERIKG